MEEGEAAPVGRVQPAAQVVPVADLMHRLVGDDLLEDRGGRVPVDLAQHQEPAVEPRGEEMREVDVERLQRGVGLRRGQQVLAHADQRDGAARAQVQRPQQRLAARLDGLEEVCEGGVGRVLGGLRGGHGGLPRRIGGAQRVDVGPVVVEQAAEEGRALGGLEALPGLQRLGRRGDARGLAPGFHQPGAGFLQLALGGAGAGAGPGAVVEAQGGQQVLDEIDVDAGHRRTSCADRNEARS